MKVYFSLVLLACIGFVFTATIDKELLRELIDQLEGLNRRQSGHTRIFVGNLSFDTVEVDLEQFFSEYGEITSCAIIKDRETGRSRGFGFVTFKNPEDADRAVEEKDGAEMGGRRLRLNFARSSRSSRGPCC